MGSSIVIRTSSLVATAALALLLAACGGETAPSPSTEPAAKAAPEQDHAHDEDSLGTVDIGGLAIELAQGHGPVVAGEEGHLVVKLPYSDQGSTTVRAWIGTEDRLLSYVGKGEYAASHDDYDVHATAPIPLPDDCRWWIEVQQPDGTVLVGSAQPILE
jgi:hypothetical protein